MAISLINYIAARDIRRSNKGDGSTEGSSDGSHHEASGVLEVDSRLGDELLGSRIEAVRSGALLGRDSLVAAVVLALLLLGLHPRRDELLAFHEPLVVGGGVGSGGAHSQLLAGSEFVDLGVPVGVDEVGRGYI